MFCIINVVLYCFYVFVEHVYDWMRLGFYVVLFLFGVLRLCGCVAGMFSWGHVCSFLICFGVCLVLLCWVVLSLISGVFRQAFKSKLPC